MGGIVKSFTKAVKTVIPAVVGVAVGVMSGNPALGMMAYSALSQAQASRQQGKLMKEQAGLQREQAGLERRRADISNARSLRSSLRQSRIAQGGLINQGANTGTLSSSGVLGGLASIGAQEGANIQAASQGQQLNEASFQTATDMASVASRAGSAQARAGYAKLGMDIGMSVFGAGGGFKKLFGG